MDFGTYLKQEHGYQSGQFIPQREAQALQVKYNKYIKDTQKKAESIEGSLALFGSQVKQAEETGKTLNPELVKVAENLYTKGSIEEANKIAKALFPQEESPAGYERVGEELQPIPGGPAALEQEEKALTKARAKESMYSAIESMVNNYVALNEAGGIVSSERGSVGNIMARVRSSGLGQSVGGTFGTEEQTRRDLINQMKPSIINSIRDSTGMSARAMDSDNELKFYLKMVSDEKLSFESNLAALKILDKRFGSGNVVDSVLSDQPELLDKTNELLGGIEKKAQASGNEKPETAADRLRKKIR